MLEFIDQNPEIVSKYAEMVEKEIINSPITKKDTSELLRAEANKLYRLRRYKTAKDLYTKSIYEAGHFSNSERLAFGNRSAVSYEEKKYQDCLKDVHNANSRMENGFIDVKLILRKASCLVHLGRYSEALAVCRDLENDMSSEAITLNKQERSRVNSLTDQIYKNLENVKTKSESDDLLHIYNQSHSTLHGASSAITLDQSQSKGRFLRTNTNVAANCVLIMEKPYVSVLLPDFWPSNCYNCLQDCGDIPTFCRFRTCTIKYCGVDCESYGWNNYHQFECSVLPAVVDTGIGHLAYRVVVYTGLHTLLEHKKLFAKEKRAQLCGTDVGEAVRKYDAIYNLVTNSQYIQPADQKHYVKTSVFLLTCLIKMDFLPKNTSIREPDALYMGSLLLRHIHQLICNAHAITVLQSMANEDSSHLVEQHEQTKLATAIYPTASMMNHSCKPNITLSFIGSKLVVKTSKDLADGDEVFNCYGPHYLKMGRNERQEALKSQYYFICDCEACLSKTNSVSKAFRCLKCAGPAFLVPPVHARCRNCSHYYNAETQINLLIEAKDLASKAQDLSHPSSSECIRMAQQSRKLIESVAHKDSIDIAEAYDLEAKCHANHGDMVSCTDCLKSGISILVKIYNPDSIELAHEYHKLSEVLCNTGDFKDALEYANKASCIFLKSYSCHHKSVKELESLCKQIKEILVME